MPEPLSRDNVAAIGTRVQVSEAGRRFFTSRTWDDGPYTIADYDGDYYLLRIGGTDWAFAPRELERAYCEGVENARRERELHGQT